MSLLKLVDGPRTVLLARNGIAMPEPKDAAECRRIAQHYVACAKQMTDPIDRATLLNMAEYWTRLAEQAEQKDRNTKGDK